jgi:hypothetical protein
VGPDGEPHAGRGWGLDVLDDGDGDGATVRVLLDASDPVTIANLAAGGAVAITAADVRTLRSTQLKGRSQGVDPPEPGDTERAARYCEAFMIDIMDTDGTPRDLLERIVPGAYVPCRVVVDDRFDQTPGPGAGERIGVAP